MRSQPTATSTSGLFRNATLVAAFVLGCQAIWVLSAEFFRPAEFPFPVDSKTAATAADARSAAARAASLGIVRGDLWADYSLTYLNLSWSDRQDSAPQQGTIEQARKVALRALAFAPHDARVWLTLASIYSRFNGPNQNTAAVLQMSYFTGANETELIPLRLLLAVHSEAIAEKDFQRLVGHDIRTIVTRKPELKSAISAAYQNALPIGKDFLELTLKDLDPELLPKLRQGN